MAHVNSIASLQSIVVKPKAWRLSDADGRFRLEFTYVAPGREPWVPVMTARGNRKTYASANAALADIAKVQAEAVIYYNATPGDPAGGNDV